jgi:hypothetical protein
MADDEEEIETEYELPSDPGIKVYINPKRQIVIRQESTMYGEDDPFVFFSVDRADRLIEMIRARKEQILTLQADEAAEKNDQRYVPGIDP